MNKKIIRTERSRPILYFAPSWIFPPFAVIVDNAKWNRGTFWVGVVFFICFSVSVIPYFRRKISVYEYLSWGVAIPSAVWVVCVLVSAILRK
jgi:hypothetical protein